MKNNDIFGTQNWKQSQADPFLAQKVAIFGKYWYVDNVDEIFHSHPHPHIPYMRIIRMNHIFRIRMANPSVNADADADADAGVGHAVSLTFSRGVNILQSWFQSPWFPEADISGYAKVEKLICWMP